MDFNGYLMSGDLEIARIEKGRLTVLDHAHMPLYLASHDNLEGWLVTRAIDRHRPNSRILKKILRLSDTSEIAAVLRAHGSTITDDYWVKTDAQENLTYEQVRYSENSFAEIALTGSFDSYSRQYSEEEIARGTPELTNIGSFEKCWRMIDGSWWLYKDGNALERFSEILIARLGKLLGFPMAEYEADDGYVRTRDFTEGRYNYEPAEAIVGDEEDYVINYDRLTALEPSLGRQYLDILFMDALCFNVDRHTQNYGILRDRFSGKILRMAPNFDNNMALISRGYGKDPRSTNGFFITMFSDLLEKCKIEYQMPVLEIQDLSTLVFSTLPEEDIDRNYVIEMVWSRFQRLKRTGRHG